jgi:hypothetical protein
MGLKSEGARWPASGHDEAIISEAEIGFCFASERVPSRYQGAA